MYRACATICFLVFFCISVAFASNDHIDITLSFGDGVSTKAGQGGLAGGLQTDRVEIPGFSSFVSSGDPALPCKLIYIALPPNADEATVAVDPGSFSTKLLHGSFRVNPVPPLAASTDTYYWGQDKEIAGGRNKLVYDTDSFYPAEHLRLRSVEHLRTWKVAVLEFWPYCYNPVTKKLRVFDSSGASLKYSRGLVDAATADPTAAQMAGFIDNQATALGWYSTHSAAPDAASATVDYVIITTSAIASSSSVLKTFVDFQAQRGHSARVVTEGEWGGGTGNVAADRIRRWLTDNYLDLNIKYVLLIGNPNPSSGDVPMKMLWPRNNSSSYKEAPSDYYYADLTGNWDRDGDGYFGEEPDDFGSGGIDRIPEVYVGRIPFYGDIQQLDSILSKTIAYESSALGSWSKRVLLPMKPLDSLTPCYQLGESIRRDITGPLGFASLRFYDSQYGLNPIPEYVPCSYDAVLNEWRQGAGMVAWLSHGAQTYAEEVITSSNCMYLDNSRPAIVFAGSCNNGRPEDSNNLGYSLLRQGAISTLSASRVSWYYVGEEAYTYSDSVGGLGYQYARYVLQQRETCGEASMHARLNVPRNIWPNQLVMNLYGDPSLAFDRATPGVISGRVITSDGDPVPGAVVKVIDGDRSVVSKQDGSYSLGGLSPGEYQLAVASAGYYEQAFAGIVVVAGRTTPLDFHLVITGVGAVSGQVMDGYGTPISEALVTLDSQRSMYSTQNGTFEFGDVTPGVHTIAASKAPYASKTIADCMVHDNRPVQVNVVLQSYRADVVLNSGFEEGFGEDGVANGWQFYSSYGSDAQPMVGTDRAKWESYSQKLHLPDSTGETRAGFYQTVTVAPGTEYTLVAWQRSHFSGEKSSPAENMVCRVGYDPTGGTAYFSPTVVWRQYSLSHDTWHVEFTDVLPYFDKTTIFIEAYRKQSGGGDDCYAWFDGIFLIGLAKAPSVPVVHIDRNYQINPNTISASWTCSDSDILEYEWAVSTSADETGIVPGGEWASVGAATSATRAGLTLKPGDAVRALVRATNSLKLTGETGVSEVVRIVEKLSSIATLKSTSVGSWVRLEDLFVTRMGEGPECFLEDAARTAGIKVVGLWSSIPYLLPGTRTAVIGCVASLDGTRVLAGGELIPSTLGTLPGAYAMNNRSVGMPISLGLLVTVWGRVASNIRDGFMLNDGSSARGLSISCFNSVPQPVVGEYVRVTGISTPYGLAVYDSNDISPLRK